MKSTKSTNSCTNSCTTIYTYQYFYDYPKLPILLNIQLCVNMGYIDRQLCVNMGYIDRQLCVNMGHIDRQLCVNMGHKDVFVDPTAVTFLSLNCFIYFHKRWGYFLNKLD